VPHAILDPFTAYAEGEELLRGQLSALSHDHLGSIVKAYKLPVDAPESMPKSALRAPSVVEMAMTSGMASGRMWTGNDEDCHDALDRECDVAGADQQPNR